MTKKRFSVEQIVGVLKQAEVGVPVESEAKNPYCAKSSPLLIGSR